MMKITFRPFLLNFLFLLGRYASKQSQKVYEQVENKHSLFTTYFMKLSVGVTIGLFALSGMFPISYAIFNFPPMQTWSVPVETQ